MQARNIISVSWGDHLGFGDADGRLASPEALRRRMERWRDDLGATTLHWRQLRSRIKQGRYYKAPGYKHVTQSSSRDVKWDDFEVVPRLAHAAGFQAYLYVSLFDDGWPLPPKKVREVSYHNAMHAQHVSWQSDFSRQHPEYALVERSGERRQWGVLCLAYPEVRAHFVERFLGLLKGYDFDGLFVCLRSQSRPADFADQFGFNEPVRWDFEKRYGRNICAEDFDLQAWRDLLGEYLTEFLSELRAELDKRELYLAVGAPRGDVLGPPLGNVTLQWREWVLRGLIDDLIINQNSSQCPSMWHQLWPMHRGYGYLQNYLDGHNLPPLTEHLDSTYAPVFAERRGRTLSARPGAPEAGFAQDADGSRDRPQKAKLYVARQWDERSEAEEAALLDHPATSGLVFSSFRFDNPGPVARGDWRA